MLSCVIDQSHLLMSDITKIEAGKLRLEDDISATKQVRLVTVLQPSVPFHLRGDSFRLRQVIANLLDNAIKVRGPAKISI